MAPSTASLNGLAVHTHGSGPPIVLLHDNGGDHRDFDEIAGQLAQRATVHAIDWPGHGDSPSVDDPGACRFAELLPAVLDQLGDGPFILIGNSVGGFAALRTAAQRPDLVKALILIDPGGFTPRSPISFIACRLFGSERIAPTAMQLLPRLYLRTRTAAVHAMRQRAITASHTPGQVRTFASIWRSFAERNHDARADAAGLSMPVVLMWGTRDPVLPWLLDGRRARRALPDATIKRFPCGHQAHIELPDAFLRVVIPFLDQLDDANR